MTYEEAIRMLKFYWRRILVDKNKDDELKRVCIGALEKQIAEKPITINHNGEKVPYCPICKELLIKPADEDYKRIFQEDWCTMDYCDRCGQAILWEE